MSKKFIIFNNALLASPTVDFHSDLVPVGTPKQDTKGGGWYEMNDLGNEITFYSTSVDFGPASLESLTEVLKFGTYPKHWNGSKFFYIHWNTRPKRSGDPSNILSKRQEIKL